MLLANHPAHSKVTEQGREGRAKGPEAKQDFRRRKLTLRFGLGDRSSPFSPTHTWGQGKLFGANMETEAGREGMDPRSAGKPESPGSGGRRNKHPSPSPSARCKGQEPWVHIPALRLAWEKSGYFGGYPTLTRCKKPQAGPSQQHPNCFKTQKRRVLPVVPPALLPGPSCSLCPQTSLPPAKARPRHLHLKNLPSAGACSSLLVLSGSPGKVFPSGLIRAAPSHPFFK